MTDFILVEKIANVGLITLNRPDVLNAWHKPMRDLLIEAIVEMRQSTSVGAVVLTGAGDRAFGAGQDLNESQSFDAERSEEWMNEWAMLYDALRTLGKPTIAALNGVAAGSAFQVALLCDIRIAHKGVRMGQPEIDAGIPSVTGPWIMREHIGLARTIELTLTGRMLDAEECMQLGLVNRIVSQERVLDEALELARELATKPPVAMRLNKMRFREMTEAGFQEALAAGVRIQRDAYATGEPARMMREFLATRERRRAKKG